MARGMARYESERKRGCAWRRGKKHRQLGAGVSAKMAVRRRGRRGAREVKANEGAK